MKLRNILAAAALVAAIGTQAEGQKYVILHNPEVDLSTLKVVTVSAVPPDFDMMQTMVLFSLTCLRISA